ncbi:MAG: 4-hydroxy-tetrahydrodipicolinate reductase, partial [Elioraea sp.]|nr:4-hydroxy-tetrahydrodipicolinate reductase [Elioraea sp.]
MRVGIAGARGRMGRLLVRAVVEHPEAVLAGGSVRAGSPAAGADLGTLAGLGPIGLAATDDPAALFAASQVVIDFTGPEALGRHLDEAIGQRKALVIGTTGLSPDQERAIAEAARAVPIVFAANFSMGVTLLAALVRRAAAALGPEF